MNSIVIGKNQSGMTMIAIVAVLGGLSLLGTTVGYWKMKKLVQSQERRSIKNTLIMAKNYFEEQIQSDAAWAQSVNTQPSLNCISDFQTQTFSCALNQEVSFVVKNKYGEDFIGSGFDENLEACDFQSDEECYFKYDFTYKAVCQGTTPCTDPEINILGKLKARSDSPFELNFSQYNVDLTASKIMEIKKEECLSIKGEWFDASYDFNDSPKCRLIPKSLIVDQGEDGCGGGSLVTGITDNLQQYDCVTTPSLASPCPNDQGLSGFDGSTSVCVDVQKTTSCLSGKAAKGIDDNGDIICETLTIPVSISSHPSSTSVSTGSGVTFSVTASGTAPITYQWYRVGYGAIGGATASTYNVSATLASNNYQYYVTATNPGGMVTSNTATLTVNGCPATSSSVVSYNVPGGSPYICESTGGDGAVVWLPESPWGATYSGGGCIAFDGDYDCQDNRAGAIISFIEIRDSVSISGDCTFNNCARENAWTMSYQCQSDNKWYRTSMTCLSPLPPPPPF